MTHPTLRLIIGVAALSLAACAPQGSTELREYDRVPWPGAGDPSIDPWTWEGRITAELCDGTDNDGDGSVDEGCTGTCDLFTTRQPTWWVDAGCVMEGGATGFSTLPIHLGSTEVYSTSAAVVTALTVDAGATAHLKLRRQLLTSRLNIAYFGIEDIDVVDWDGDGSLETYGELVDLADAQYDAGADWLQSVWAAQLKEMNDAGIGNPLWFDETCADASTAEYCDGIDNDGDGSTDESCGCIEKCGDSYDNDSDGSVDEGCADHACETYASRNYTFWTAATCVVDGDVGFDPLPITLGTTTTYTTTAEVEAALAVAPGGDGLLRLRRQLLLAKLNLAAFNLGAIEFGDVEGDGDLDTLSALVAEADALYDSGASWRRTTMATKLRTANEWGSAVTIYFRSDCSTEAEFCDGLDNDHDGTVDEYCGCAEACDGYDNDFDGSVDEDYPSGCPADEVCDGIDNDGDGLVDEADAVDAGDWYYDGDSDGYGNSAVATTACDMPTGYVSVGGDCDDADGTRYPGATDVCDGKDNDCDGATDEEAPTWYADNDVDNYGDPSSSRVTCTAPSGYVADNTDCDDTNAEVNPAQVDYCGDGLDNDCSGSEVGCYSPTSGEDAIFIGESAGDEAGISAARVGDLDGDGVDDVVIGARGNDFTGSNAGAAYLFYGPVTYSGEVSLANADLTLVGNVAGDRAGRTVIGGGDLDGDGTADLTIGAPNEDTSGNSAGAAYVFFGSSVSAITDPVTDMTAADATYYGRDDYDYLGTRTSYSELTGDSTIDLLLSVTGDSVSGTNAGGIYVYAGPLSAGSWTISDGTWAARILGEVANDEIGLYVGTNGDINGDGSGDVVIGVPRHDTPSTDIGATYLVAGPLSGTINLTDADAKIFGAHADDKLGSAVSFAGDQNSDGYDDFFVTAPFEDTVASNAGAVYLVHGTPTLGDFAGLDIEAIAAATILGKEASGQIGSSVAADGDHDGDGINDLLTGANNDGPEAEGATYLFFGPINGSLTWADADYSLLGETAYDHTGSFVSYGGDLRGLGGDTLIIGGREADYLSSADNGKVYLIFDATY